MLSSFNIMKSEKLNFQKIEKKWQDKWEKKKIFQVKESGKKKKFYVLEMFPYPSGSGLHMGHAFNYTIGDIYARFKRMNGFNVLYPMGYDSFGLPAENAAIGAKTHPKKFTEKSISNFIKQQKVLGLSYDWSRMLKTSDSEYYKWNQFFFLKFFEKGFVYKKKAPVNFCEKCNTVLANEQVHNGKCWRHPDTGVKVKHLEQWFIKTTDYVEELLSMTDDLEWPTRIKTMQKNWIGKSHGTEIEFNTNGKSWKVFTTRPDTLYGVTFMVVSAQHEELMEFVTKGQEKKVKDFLKKIKTIKQEDLDKLDKEGVFSGSYAINPINGEKIPVWIGNFVVADYGSGMVMAVPAHDQRDFEFATKFGIPMKVVVEPKEYKIYSRNGKLSKAYSGEGTLVNSNDFNGLETKEAREKITNYLKKKRFGKKTVQYKMRDWLVSRQRYWGTPIPIIYCDGCGIVPVPEKDLPVLLPQKVKFGKGNPLETNKKFLEVKCPNCGGKGRRETDTMDTFFDSSWYFLRYTDNGNSKEPFSKNKVRYWSPVDQYIGGAEHATMHLMYARFFVKALRDLGFLEFDEPFKKLFNQGMLHGKDGFVMSKSRGNVVLPEKISKKYSIDTARFFLVSIASPNKDIQWTDKGVRGSFRFTKKVMNFLKNSNFKKYLNPRVEHKLNKTIKEVSEYIENFQYNLAVIKLRELFNFLEAQESGSKKVFENFIKLLHPFCPHLTEELWEKLGNKNFLSLSSWPSYDEKKIDERFDKEDEIIKKVAQDIIHVKQLIGKDKPIAHLYPIPPEMQLIKSYEDQISNLSGSTVITETIGSPTIYDPEGKSKKAKPGRPGIYLE